MIKCPNDEDTPLKPAVSRSQSTTSAPPSSGASLQASDPRTSLDYRKPSQCGPSQKRISALGKEKK